MNPAPFARARDRLGPEPLRLLFEQSAKPAIPTGHPDVFWRGLRKVVVDGTVFDVPAGDDNAATFATPSGGVLPQARLVALAKCGSPGTARSRFRLHRRR